jgi:2-polyprenyl-3-methyl-5-hydroxy-6-metoxy-1,4-benzoquinol methylase
MIQDGIFIYTSDNEILNKSELQTRDRQSGAYLQHGKFPTQIQRFKKFLDSIPASNKEFAVVDLGCGPGPFTNIIAKAGFNNITAVDFSIDSLKQNREHIENSASRIDFIRADLMQLKLPEKTFGLVVMSDFLQHLGSFDDKIRFLQNSFKSLRPGGFFILSFFNFNIKNYVKSDLHGSFADNTIQYERLLPKDLIKYFPKEIKLLRNEPMNISNSSFLDTIFCSLPLSRFLSRMWLITGYRSI